MFQREKQKICDKIVEISQKKIFSFEGFNFVAINDFYMYILL